MLLETAGLTKRFGGVVALNAVDLAVPTGQIFGLIGPNGAGKTTLINLISGHFRADDGTIRFADADITHLRPHQLAGRGIALDLPGDPALQRTDGPRDRAHRSVRA